MSKEIASQAKSWPFEEARRILERIGGKTPARGYVSFKTGYGASGLPHIGTFGEVARTLMVKHALAELAPEIPSRLVSFSDDLDGLRKVPDNVPNKDMLIPHLGRAITSVPDPYGCHGSFADHNNAMMCRFLDSFGFKYEFLSSTACYKSGRFDSVLNKFYDHMDDIEEIILPTLGDERQSTYCPFLPISPKTGRVLQVPVVEKKASSKTLVFRDEDGSLFETSVTGGNVKLQWKCDWAMQWIALEVDYEMCGKDLIDSVTIGSAILRKLGYEPPVNLVYEHFLDEKGGKISKSKGNGISVDQWLTYAPAESLSLFMYHQPKRAKKLFFDVIPKNVDEYLTWIEKYPAQTPLEKLDNPAWHIHNGDVPKRDSDLGFGILLNLAGVANSEDKKVLWSFITRYKPEIHPESAPYLDKLVGYAINYYRDFIKPTKKYRAANENERKGIEAILKFLETAPADATAEAIQNEIYEIGKRVGFEADLRGWFKSLYEVLLGQEQGPRMGSFISLYGRKESMSLMKRALAGEDLAKAG